MAKLREAAIALGFETKPLRDYKEADFDHIDRKLNKYWYSKEVEGKTYNLFDKEKFYRECGALNSESSVIVENFHWGKNKAGESVARVDEPTRFSRAQHLLHWYLWRRGNNVFPRVSYEQVKLLDAPDTDYKLDITF